MKLVFVVLLLVGNTLLLSEAAAEERISFLKKLRLLQGRPLGLDYCLCPSIYMPVCASDQQTYSNACKARCKTKVSSQYTYRVYRKVFSEMYLGKRPYRVSRKVLNRILNNILKHKNVKKSHISASEASFVHC